MADLKPTGKAANTNNYALLKQTFYDIKPNLVQTVKDAPQGQIDLAKTTLSSLSNWQAATDAERQNALYFALAVIYAVVAVLIDKVINGE